LKRGKPAKR